MNYPDANNAKYWLGATVGLLIISIVTYGLIPEVNIQINRGLSMVKLHDVMGLTIQYHSLNWAGALAVALSALQVLIVFLDYPTVVTANVAAFGWLIGMLLSWGGMVIGTLLAYSIGRVLAYPFKSLYPQLIGVGKRRAISWEWLFTLAASLLPWGPLKLVFLLNGWLARPGKLIFPAVAVGGLVQTTMIACWGLTNGSYGSLILIWGIGSLIVCRLLSYRRLQ